MEIIYLPLVEQSIQYYTQGNEQKKSVKLRCIVRWLKKASLQKTACLQTMP